MFPLTFIFPAINAFWGAAYSINVLFQLLEFHRQSHVSFNFYFPGHKCLLGVQFATHHVNEILVLYCNLTVTLSSTGFEVFDGSGAVFEVDQKLALLSALAVSDLEQIATLDFLH